MKTRIPWMRFVGFCPVCNSIISGKDVFRERIFRNGKLDLQGSTAECPTCHKNMRVKKLLQRIQSRKPPTERDPFWFWKCSLAKAFAEEVTIQTKEEVKRLRNAR